MIPMMPREASRDREICAVSALTPVYAPALALAQGGQDLHNHIAAQPQKVRRASEPASQREAPQPGAQAHEAVKT